MASQCALSLVNLGNILHALKVQYFKTGTTLQVFN